MYEVIRNHVVEDLRIRDNDKELVVHVDINIDNVLAQYSAAAKVLADAQVAMQKGVTAEKIDALHDAIRGVFTVVFGADQMRQIEEFYDGSYTEMLADVAPFVNDVVAPKINEAQQRIMEKYKNVKRFKK